MGAELLPTVVALVSALLSIPVCYGYTLLCESLSQVEMLAVAGAIMTAVVAISAFLTKGKVKNKMYYGFSLFTFTAVIDIIGGLEADGIVHGFMTTYLKHGEPYLLSAWGAVACYWDGTVFLTCYIIMVYLSSNGRSYRTLGLHWSSSILNSMVVLLLGACLSESGPGWCTILNTPYVLFPLAVAVQCLAETPSHQPQTNGKPSWLDKALVVLLIESSLAALLKGLATCGSKLYIPNWYRTVAEPILEEQKPAPFAAIQGLVTLFYFLPGYLAVAWGLMTNPGQRWLQDLAVILAGASFNAGGSTVATVFHGLTKPEHRLPSTVNHSAYWAFWGVNTLLSIVPQIVAVRLMWLPVHVSHQVKNGKQKTNRKGQEKQKKNPRKLKEN
ncbi:Transmembrane 6 superfamily member 1 [Cryptotermes secundus]|uniref:Transmembrane 6 superfamily member 1 n=2 Tax=Cryptotermes secundus TaxID=105785 RepID=A0A2J7PYS1_9NEOP|nr:transmembrane 6 superfamily member 1 isoform X2 [Cryptotermes secundus]XP_023719452.1 transmembrane 6 superfamily member 1 isoform X2 [Cryptotermes secundus]PNF21482.1 Transmembrane 6 superfamily member 1 [Cryptotermes secundus]PNF21483.1 Transmembrane 6 superfamily member 1 [Cryptotermes secundus]PNF21484.1 Transmembrane 6 superfamily member 1 [Cryptotermes secundus]